MEELKPCPFCGSQHILTATQKPFGMAEYFMIKCFDCSAEITRSTKRKAIKAWEMRTDNEELQFTRAFIHEHGLEFALAEAWNRRA